MSLNLLQIIVLGIIQGAAELLPVSSSAHVVVAEKLMGIDPARPETTFLLVMLHTGTMLAVIVYFWQAWRARYFASGRQFAAAAKNVILASVLTALVGFGLIKLIEKKFLAGAGKAEIEELFGNLLLVGLALAGAGILILWSSGKKAASEEADVTGSAAAWIGLVQGLCLPFRGFSRSGATISTGLLANVARRRAEEFSFALAVVLTPAAILKEGLRLRHAAGAGGARPDFAHLAMPGFLGLVCSLLAGLVALRLLSRWLEAGRWHYFGIYCLVAAVAVLGLAFAGY